MGESKRRLEAARLAFLAEIDYWSFPATDWEKSTIQKLRSLPEVLAERLPEKQLISGKMIPRDCHGNSHFAALGDPSNSSQHVMGWLVKEDRYLLHSLIKQTGKYICVTPAPFEPRRFKFVPDTELVWREEGNNRIFYRDGFPVPRGVRFEPERTIAEMASLRERLLSGTDPYVAMGLKT